MTPQSKNVLKVAFSLIAIAASGGVLYAMFAPEGDDSKLEEAKALAAINTAQEILDKGGHVKELKRLPPWGANREGENAKEGEQEPPRRNRMPMANNFFRYEAEIFNGEDVPIGLLHGGRVEGFATSKPRIQWYKTPGVREEWVQQPRGEGRGRRGGFWGGNREGEQGAAR